ncbi:hypothetical protein RvY_13492 [Ramazzottius varieornatus]|uniref:Uncharacterized protein n=1 Tax=Ramazzottius varieornatus TaxID=947166 RepID=A0A1D1VPW3_RAMVA|nr:hypothetical protein RvY_13492 [Ramazzottius varieornatus]
MDQGSTIERNPTFIQVQVRDRRIRGLQRTRPDKKIEEIDLSDNRWMQSASKKKRASNCDALLVPQK